MAKDEYEKAVEQYWEDSEKGKEYYDSIRGAADADPDEWERNLQREDAYEGDDDD